MKTLSNFCPGELAQSVLPGKVETSPGPMEIHYIGIFSENIIELNRNLRAIFDYQLPSGKQT